MSSFNFYMSLIGKKVKDTKTDKSARVVGIHIYVDKNKHIREPRVYLGETVRQYRPIGEIEIKGENENEQMFYDC